MDKPLPASAKELRKSESGRKILANLQERYKRDLLQPTINGKVNPEFVKVYGDKISRDTKVRQSQEKVAREEKGSIQEHREIIKQRQHDHLYKKVF